MAYQLVSPKLAECEADIDLASLADSHTSNNYEQRKRHFPKTVIAIHCIVESKLYKARKPSLEAYFKDRFAISRAQVYRFMDSALVLQALENVDTVPCRERQCRAIKKVTRTRNHRLLLWLEVLHKYGKPSADSVTSTQIEQLWKDMVRRKAVDPLEAGDDEITPILQQQQQHQQQQQLHWQQHQILLQQQQHHHHQQQQQQHMLSGSADIYFKNGLPLDLIQNRNNFDSTPNLMNSATDLLLSPAELGGSNDNIIRPRRNTCKRVRPSHSTSAGSDPETPGEFDYSYNPDTVASLDDEGRDVAAFLAGHWAASSSVTSENTPDQSPAHGVNLNTDSVTTRRTSLHLQHDHHQQQHHHHHHQRNIDHVPEEIFSVLSRISDDTMPSMTVSLPLASQDALSSFVTQDSTRHHHHHHHQQQQLAHATDHVQSYNLALSDASYATLSNISGMGLNMNMDGTTSVNTSINDFNISNYYSIAQNSASLQHHLEQSQHIRQPMRHLQPLQLFNPYQQFTADNINNAQRQELAMPFESYHRGTTLFASVGVDQFQISPTQSNSNGQSDLLDGVTNSTSYVPTRPLFYTSPLSQQHEQQQHSLHHPLQHSLQHSIVNLDAYTVPSPIQTPDMSNTSAYQKISRKRMRLDRFDTIDSRYDHTTLVDEANLIDNETTTIMDMRKNNTVGLGTPNGSLNETANSVGV